MFKRIKNLLNNIGVMENDDYEEEYVVKASDLDWVALDTPITVLKGSIEEKSGGFEGLELFGHAFTVYINTGSEIEHVYLDGNSEVIVHAGN